MITNLKKITLILVCGFLFFGCETTNRTRMSMSDIASKRQFSSPIMKEGIRQLKANNLKAAAQMFRSQLKLVPQNALAHFFNALTYEKMAQNGDDQYLDMAHVGFSVASNIDPSNYLFQHHKGLVELNKKKYKEAQGSFSTALMLKPDSIKSLYGLAVSSYYAYDLTTAVGSIERVMLADPENPLYLRTAAIIMAAGGKSNKANVYANKLAILEGNYAKDAQYVQDRIKAWGHLYQVVQSSSANSGLKTASDVPKTVSDSTKSSAENSASSDKQQTKSTLTSSAAGETGSVSNYVSPGLKNPYSDKFGTRAASLIDSGITEKLLTYASQPKPLDPSNQMVLIDIVIMIAEESSTEGYGVNLLDNLSLLLNSSGSVSGGSAATGAGFFSWADSKTKQVGDTTITSGTSLSITNTTGYTLNIANVNGNKNEVIARPTLTTLSGKQATFSSGDDIVVATSGNGDNSIAGPYNLGINLIVTPTILEGGRVSLDIQANRKAVNSGSAPSGANFSQSLYTGHTQITSTVEMNIGDTLILGGLSERTDSSSTDAVPLLGDIPALQYFFRKDSKTQYRKSVIFLVTPRQPDYTYIDAIGGVTAHQNSPVVQALFELKNRYTEWFQPDPNISEAFKHFQKIGVYREFRNGDALVEEQESLENILEEVAKNSGQEI